MPRRRSRPATKLWPIFRGSPAISTISDGLIKNSALRPGIGDDERRRALDSARLAYDDAASRRGYISALNDLAVLDEMDDGVAAQALDLFRRGAQQAIAAP